MTPPLSAIILAGGRSWRMGTDKSSLRIGGKTLLERTIEILLSLTDDIVVVGRPPIENLQLPASFIPDQIPDVGPLGGLHSGLAAVRHCYVACVSCDLPFLNTDLLLYLIGVAGDYDAVVPRADGHIHPLHALYQSRIAGAVDVQLRSGTYGMTRLLHELRVRWVDEEEIERIDPSHRSLINVNTPEEWYAARASVNE